MSQYANSCYTDGQLTESLDGEMNIFADVELSTHLSRCGECAERMRENVELEHFVSSLLRPVGPYVMQVCSNLDFSGK